MRRRAALAAAALVLLAAGIAFALAPGAIERAVTERLAENGVSAEVRINRDGLALIGITALRGGLRVTCDRADVPIRWTATLRARAPRLSDVAIGRCSVRQADRAVDAAAPADGGQGVDVPRIVDALSEHLRSVRMAQVDLSIGGLAGVGAEWAWDAQQERGSGTWRGSAPTAWTTDVSVSITDEGAVAVDADTPLEVGPCTLAPPRVMVSPTEVVVRDGHVACDAAEASFARAAFAPAGHALPEIALSGVHITQHPFARASATETPTDPDAPEAPPQVPPEGPQRTEARPAPPAFLAQALGRASDTLTEASAIRAELRTLLATLPAAVSAVDVTVADGGPCGALTFERLAVGSRGVSAVGRCGAIGFDLEAPGDAEANWSLSLTDVHADALGETVGGTLDGRVVLAEAPTPQLRATATATSFSLQHAALSPEPVVVPSATFSAEFAPTEDSDGLRWSWEATLGEARFSGDGTARPEGERWRVDAAFWVADSTSCQVLWEALPAGLHPDLPHEALQWSGEVAGADDESTDSEAVPRMSFQYTAGVPDSFRLQTGGTIGCVPNATDSRFDPAVLLSETFIQEVTEGVDAPVFVGPGTPGYIGIDAVPSYVPALMHLSEEVAFFDNNGFSRTLIARAVRTNIADGRYVYGGSTVTQQLVKNLYFSREKTIARKVQEAVIVWAVEASVPKWRILELYMNCIEFGPNVYGIQAAAQHYFGVDAATLTPLEAAFLAALKPAPWRGDAVRARGESPAQDWWNERLVVLLDRLIEYGPYITPEERASYAPHVVRFAPEPGHPLADRPGRPKGAVTETLREARARLGLPIVAWPE